MRKGPFILNKSRVWIIVLCMAVSVSGAVGSVQGRRGAADARIPDIGHGEQSAETGPSDKNFHLAGRVWESDGVPAAGQILTFQGESLTTVTDSEGAFLLTDLSSGTYEIALCREDGTVRARQNISIYCVYGVPDVSFELLKGEYSFRISTDIRYLEIAISVDEETISISPDQYSYATRGGRIRTPHGTFYAQENSVTTPAGNTFLSDGTIVVPGSKRADPSRLILPDDDEAPD